MKMLFFSLVVYCFLCYNVLTKLFPLWEAVKLERNPFSEDNFLVFFWCRFLGILLTLHWDVCVYFCKNLQQIWKSLGFAYTGK